MRFVGVGQGNGDMEGNEPRQGNNVKRLKGEWSGYLRYRVGDWRVIFRVDDKAGQVNVVVIAHRREVVE